MKYMISFQCDTVEEAKAVVDAVAAIGKAPMTTSRVIDDPAKILASEPTPTTAEPRLNVSPGVPSITKIGGKAKEHVLDCLRLGNQPSPAYAEHMKLLWSRGEIKFDGKEYYV